MEYICSSCGKVCESLSKEGRCRQCEKKRTSLKVVKVIILCLLAVLIVSQVALCIYAGFSSTDLANEPRDIVADLGEKQLVAKDIEEHVWMDQIVAVLFAALVALGCMQFSRVQKSKKKLSALYSVYTIVGALLPMLYAFLSDIVVIFHIHGMSGLFSQLMPMMTDRNVLGPLWDRYKTASVVVFVISMAAFALGFVYTNARKKVLDGEKKKEV